MINVDKLKKAGACDEGIVWLESLGTLDSRQVIEQGIQQKQFEHLCYGLSFLMTKRKRVTWAIYCAETCLEAFESEHPQDDRPRKAIEAAKAYLKRPCARTKDAARAAAEYAARAAAYSALAAESAADSAAYSAESAESAADSAAYEDIIWKGYEILTMRPR